MKLSGDLTLFVKERKTKDGKSFNTYTTTVGSKQEDGSYLNASMDVVFTKEEFPESKLSKLSPKRYYRLEVEEAYHSVRAYNDAEGKEHRVIILVIVKATVKDSKEIINSTEEVPF